MLWQRIEINQEYGATFKHLAEDLNVGADGLSRHNVTSKTPVRTMEKVYAIGEVDGDGNEDFPIAMRLVKEEHANDDKLQQLPSKPGAAAAFTTREYNGISLHCLEGRVWTPSSLQLRIVDWYHTNLMHAASTRTLKTIQ